MNTNNKLAIVGIFWDGYYDMWEDFLELKEKFWKDCPYPLYIVNQTKEIEFKKKYDVTVLHAGEDAEYSKKVQLAIDAIDADYLLILLEDFFFSRSLSGGILDERLFIMKENNIKYCSMPLPGFYQDLMKKYGNRKDFMLEFNQNAEYVISCMPSIWEKSFLKSCIGSGNYNAWVFEAIYLNSKTAHKDPFLSWCRIDVGNKLGLLHGALQSKMIPTTLAYYQGIGYKMKNERPVMGKWSFFKHRLKSYVRITLPACVRVQIKKLIGGESVTDRYTEQAFEEMKRMNLK